MTEVRLHRVLTVLLTAALLATLTVALTGGQRADAVDGPVDVVYVATGRNFPDALAGANLAATVGAPLLTVEPDLPIPDTTLTALQSLDPDRIIVLGGPAAVSDAVVDALAAHARSGSVTRIEGTDRHDTAAAIADALPDRVHDADTLDGLDSSAFLRSNATIDADTLAGTSHADLRSVPMPWPTKLSGAAIWSYPTGVYAPDTGYSNISFTVLLPSDRSPGEPLVVDAVLFSYDPNCRLSLHGLGSHYGADGYVEQQWPVAPVDSTGRVSVGDDRIVRVRFTAPPVPAGYDDSPGTPVRLILIRLADDAQDDCGGMEVLGATLRY